MSRPWARDKAQARIWLVLEAAGEAGLSKEALGAALPRITRPELTKALFKLTNQRWLLENREEGQGLHYRTNPGRGRPPIEGDPAPAALPAGTPGDLAAAAAEIICGAPDTGSDSVTLARLLGCTIHQVEGALEQAVLDHKLITCRVRRGGLGLTAYRTSASGVRGYDWRAQRDATWANRQALASTPIVAPAEAPPPRTEAQPTAAPKPARQPRAPRRAAEQREQLAAVEAASEIAPPAAAPAPAEPARLQYMGELDIDAADHRAAAAQGREVGDFLAALYSNGALLIDSHGKRLTLPLAHTRKLFHYLAHLGALDVVEELSKEATPS